jgi:FkbM family methyltransferase
MSRALQATTAALKRSARASAIRLGQERQARELIGRFREARSAFDPPLRQELRDEHALRIILAAVLRADSNAIDVGANEGAVLESVVRIAPAGRHIAFEPIPDLHARLVARFPDVEIRPVALSDVAESTELFHVLDAPAYSGLRQREDLPSSAGNVRRIPVRTERLDDVLEDGYVPALLKIDVEGAELNVLRGATETLHRHRPFVVFEHGVGGADLYGAHPTEVFDLLHDAHLRIFDLEGTGPYTRERFQETFTAPIWNFLAAPG